MAVSEIESIGSSFCIDKKFDAQRTPPTNSSIKNRIFAELLKV